MKIIFLLTFFILSVNSNAQIADRIRFEYDASGNQVLRTLCLGCSLSRNSEKYKEVDDLDKEDLLKFVPEDNISYYPNPVKENLFLKWEIEDGSKLSNIEIYTSDGKLIKQIFDVSESSIVLSFEGYSTGNYFVLMYFTNNKNKSITIIKK